MPSTHSPAVRQPTVFLATSIGVGVRYFFQTEIVPTLLEAGIRVIGLVPDPEAVQGELASDPSSVPLEALRPARPGPEQANGRWRALRLARNVGVEYLRTFGMSRRMNLAVIRDSRAWEEHRLTRGKARYLVPPLRLAAAAMRRSRAARAFFTRYLESRPPPNSHADLFDTYAPDLVVVSSPGWWPEDEDLIREARARGVPTLAVVVGWDHPSSKGLPAARPDRTLAWSEVQRRELVDGSDMDPDRIAVAGVAHFDYYLRDGFAVSREEFFAQHSLDRSRRLITFGCSFVGISSNVEIVRRLAEAVAGDRLAVPAQLLIRLHPTHLKRAEAQYVEVVREVDAYEQMARDLPHVHLDRPLVTGRDVANLTTRADLVGLASLLRHSDVFVTLFSTMALEAAVNDTPTVTVALDPPPEWRWEHAIPITRALDWPTHQRIIASGATTVALSPEEMTSGVNAYLRDRTLDAEARRRFALQECTFLNSGAGERIASYILSMATKGVGEIRPESVPQPS
ncbi:MAG: hypothetical protein HY688_02290 [Chloroflexi bacterium]|nr:hypothetical protein [Chloroflexota bacterium]